jgi:pimeloyl-ACP methyl ester carboxylesterase
MLHTAAGIRYEVHGQGIPLFLGYPITASGSPEDPLLAILGGYLDRLSDRYRTLVVDYSSPGGDAPVAASECTADRVCADLFAVADAAGFDRFAWWGFSWGGVIGLQLASRSDRVTALVCGGWPPLGGPYAELLSACRAMAANPPDGMSAMLDQYVQFYESLQGWPEARVVPLIACPRMTFVGSADEVDLGAVKVPLAATIRSRRAELEKLGWHLTEIPDRDHSIWTDPGTVVPIVRRFLDRAT